MKHPAARTRSRYIFVISLLLAVLFGCSTVPTAQPVKDVKSIRGKWEGWGENHNYGRFFITLEIREDGEWKMQTTGDPNMFKGNQFYGKTWIAEDKFEAFTETPALRGAYTLHAGEGRRWLVFMSDDGKTTAELSPSFR
jgi:hypothetical protein